MIEYTTSPFRALSINDAGRLDVPGSHRLDTVAPCPTRLPSNEHHRVVERFVVVVVIFTPSVDVIGVSLFHLLLPSSSSAAKASSWTALPRTAAGDRQEDDDYRSGEGGRRQPEERLRLTEAAAGEDVARVLRQEIVGRMEVTIVTVLLLLLLLCSVHPWEGYWLFGFEDDHRT